jgi:outer membrane receptor protein involved in Fe transport
VLAVSGVIQVGTSRAEEATSQPALTEIIVTAQKREQNVQDVPISVIALSGQQLKDAGVTDIKNLTVLTPGVTVTSTTSENITTARIRGIGTVGDNPGLESSVGVVIDGIYRPRNGVGFGNLGEIDQIEVLEGPQGELFGKNNDAGVISITTKRPSTTFGVTAEATYGNYNDRELSASVTGPLGDISAGRLYVGYQKRDGFELLSDGVGPSTANRANDRDVYTLRGQYQLTFTEDVSLLFIGDYSKRDESCCAAVVTSSGPFAGIANAVAGVPALGGTGALAEPTSPLNPFDYRAYANQPITQRIRDTGVSAQLDWNLGIGKLTSITAWRDNTIVAGNDLDYTGLDILEEPSGLGNQTDFKQFSQEIRLAGRNGPLDWLVGGFFSNEILDTGTDITAGDAFDTYISGLASAAAGVPNFGLIPGLTGNAPGGTFIPGVSGEADYYHQTSKSYAFFTNETYNIARGLDLTGGLRFTSEKKTADSNYVSPDGGAACGQLLASPGEAAIAANPLLAGENAFLVGYGCATLFNPFFAGKSTSQSLSEGNVSESVKLSYHVNDDAMTYLSWATGYKAGGFNLSRTTSPPTAADPAGLAPNFDTEFPRETVTSWELGVKSEYFNKTLRVNAAAFDQNYTDFQLNTYTGIQFVVSTLPRVSSDGVEIDTQWATPLSGLSLSAGLTYALTDIREFGPAANLFAPPIGANNPAYITYPGEHRLNNRLSYAPLWSGVASAAYTIPITSALQFRANVTDKYSSSYNTGSDLDPLKLQGGYGVLNARLGLGAPDGKWTVEIWGQNLADKGYYQVAFDAPIQYEQIDAFLADPRTFGITFRTKF